MDEFFALEALRVGRLFFFLFALIPLPNLFPASLLSLSLP